MDKNKKKILTIIFIILAVIAVLAISLSILFKDNEEQPTNPSVPVNPDNGENTKTYNVFLKELEDLTLYNSINATMNSLYSNIHNISITIFQNDYRKNNNITSANISSLFTNSSSDLSFRVKETYYGNQNHNYCFIFTGYTYLSGIDDLPKIDEFKYFIIHLNTNTNTYNIEFITQNEFNNIKNKKQYSTYEVSKSSADLIYQNLSEANLAKVYFNNLKTNLIANPEYVYNILDNETKNNYFNTLESFKNYINTNILLINDYDFSSYNKVDKEYYIIDSSQNEYIFTSKSVFDFKVKINFRDLNVGQE